jgi:hypothetical protein
MKLESSSNNNLTGKQVSFGMDYIIQNNMVPGDNTFNHRDESIETSNRKTN